jgi:O-antigen/teichoic acid export membrane protein
MSEKHTKSVNLNRINTYIRERPILKRILGGAFWSLLGTAVTRILSMVTNIWIARVLGKEDYGGYGIVYSTLDTFSLFGGLALGFTMIKYIAEYRSRDPAKAGMLLRLARSTVYFSAGVMAIGLFVLSDQLAVSMLNRADLSGLLKIGAVYMFLRTINNIQLGSLAGFEAFRETAKINIITGLLTPLLTIPLVYLFNLYGAVIASVVVALVGYGYCAIVFRRKCELHGIAVRVRNWTAYREWPELLRFSIPAFISGLLLIPVTWLTNAMLVNQPEGYGQMGLFNAANQWRQFIIFIPSVMSAVMLAVSSDSYAEGKGDKYRVAYLTNMKLTWSCALPAAIIIISFAGPLNYMFGKKFSQAQTFIPPLIVAAFFAVLNMVGSSAVTGAGRMWTETGLNLIWGLLILVLSFFLVPAYGAMGLAYANLIASFVQVAARLYYIERVLIPNSIVDFRFLIIMTIITLCLVLLLCWGAKFNIFWGAGLAALGVTPLVSKAREIFSPWKVS